MFRSIAIALLLAVPLLVRADEEVPPLDPYLGEQVTLVGLPGDEGFYELHVRPNGDEYYVDAEGVTYRNLEELLVKREAK